MDFDEIARQLAHPKGAFGIDVALGMNHLNEFISKNTYDLLQISNSDKVLEIGLGNGKFVKDVLSNGKGIFYTGVDISDLMIKEARKQNHQLISSGFVDLVLADIEEMPFWDGIFNKICSVNTIYFWKNPLKALREVHRVLATNGLSVIAFRPYVEGKSLNFSQYGFSEYRTEEVRALIQKANFNIIDIIDRNEPSVEFDGKIHDLVSQYFVSQKK